MSDILKFEDPSRARKVWRDRLPGRADADNVNRANARLAKAANADLRLANHPATAEVEYERHEVEFSMAMCAFRERHLRWPTNKDTLQVARSLGWVRLLPGQVVMDLVPPGTAPDEPAPLRLAG